MKPFTELVNDKDSCEKILKHFAGENAEFDKVVKHGSSLVYITGHCENNKYSVFLWNEGDVYFDVNGKTEKSFDYTDDNLPGFFITLGYGPKL